MVYKIGDTVEIASKSGITATIQQRVGLKIPLTILLKRNVNWRKMMKKLYLIGGTMGVGKTTVCQLLKEKLNHAVFLDGDWCWDSDPFHVTEQTKAMVIDNICHLLNNFIRCTAYENIIFCWVMHEQSIIDELLARMDLHNYDLKAISLICSPEVLRQRLNKDIEAGIRKPDILERSLERIPMYDDLNTIKIDVSHLTPIEVAELIATR